MNEEDFSIPQWDFVSARDWKTKFNDKDGWVDWDNINDSEIYREWREARKYLDVIHYEIINEKLNPELVVDAGCGGANRHKEFFPNVIGFDPCVSAKKSDYRCNILDAPLEKGSVDAVFCEGVAHFGDLDYIGQNMKTIFGWLKPNAIVVMMVHIIESEEVRKVGRPHKHEWTKDMVRSFGEQYGVKLLSPYEGGRQFEGTPDKWGKPNRVYWVWEKNTI